MWSKLYGVHGKPAAYTPAFLAKVGASLLVLFSSPQIPVLRHLVSQTRRHFHHSLLRQTQTHHRPTIFAKLPDCSTLLSNGFHVLPCSWVQPAKRWQFPSDQIHTTKSTLARCIRIHLAAGGHGGNPCARRVIDVVKECRTVRWRSQTAKRGLEEPGW